MGDADDTYPLQELTPFVEHLEQGDDLVIGSRFNGTIHGDAMPFLNRFFGLSEALAGVLGRPVDLVEPQAVRNPYIRASIDRAREVVYGS